MGASGNGHGAVTNMHSEREARSGVKRIGIHTPIYAEDAPRLFRGELQRR